MHISRLFFYCSSIILLTVCGGGGGSEISQSEPQPANPSQGTVLSSYCDGANWVQQVADGSGGSNVTSELAPNQCGYFTEPVSFTIPQTQYSADGNFVLLHLGKCLIQRRLLLIPKSKGVDFQNLEEWLCSIN